MRCTIRNRSCETAFHLFTPCRQKTIQGRLTEEARANFTLRKYVIAGGTLEWMGMEEMRRGAAHTTQLRHPRLPMVPAQLFPGYPWVFWSRSQFSPLNHGSSHAAPWQVVVASTVNKQNYTKARTKARDKEGCAVAKWITPSCGAGVSL